MGRILLFPGWGINYRTGLSGQKNRAFQRIVEIKNAVFNMVYHEKQIWNYRDGIVDEISTNREFKRLVGIF